MDGLLQDDLFGIITVGYEELLAEALHEAVLSNDVETLERVLKEPSSNINCLKYGDNLLVTAIRHERTAAAVWLVEHGIDSDFETCHLVLHDPEPPPATADDAATAAAATAAPERKLGRQNTKTALDNAARRAGGSTAQRPAAAVPPPDLYSVSCRQLAYEKQLWTIVSAIDVKKGADLKTTRRYPDMRHYSKAARLHRRVAARAEPQHADDRDDVGGGGGGASEEGRERRQDGERPPSGAPVAHSGLNEVAADSVDVAGACAFDAERGSWPLSETADLVRRCQLAEDERTSSPTIFWRRSTLTKSAKIRQRLEHKLCGGGGGGGDVAPQPSSRQQQQPPPPPPQPLAARASEVNKEISRLLTVAAAAASAIGASRPHSSARAKADKAFSHPSIMRAHSSKMTKQSSAA